MQVYDIPGVQKSVKAIDKALKAAQKNPSKPKAPPDAE